MKILKKPILLIDLLIFLFSFSVFYITCSYYADADITVHNKFIQLFNQGKIPLSGHFLFFLTVSILSFFSENYNFIVIICCVVLSLMIVFKRRITEFLIEKINNGNSSQYYFLLSVLFIFLTNMPSHPPFNGIWPPISWINSTVIFVFPFCILLFYYSYLYVNNLSAHHLIKLVLLSLLIIITKPSYIFVFVVAFPVFTFIKKRTMFFKSVILSTVLIILIFIQYLYIYHFYINQVKIPNYPLNYENIRLSIDFFNAWHRISSNLVASSVTWFSLPISIMILYGKRLIKEYIYLYALIGFLISFLIFITFEERVAAGYAHGALNFLWQLIIALYIWSVVSVSLVFKYSKERGNFIWKDKIVFGIFIYYVFAAMAYLFNTVFVKIL